MGACRSKAGLQQAVPAAREAAEEAAQEEEDLPDDPSEDSMLAATEAPAPPPGAAPQPAERRRTSERRAMALLDGLSEAAGVKVYVSFPGIHQDEWNNMVATAKLLQQLDPTNSWFSTACVFLPDCDANIGQHSRDDVTNNGFCFCQKLYGCRTPWGCRWFDLWRNQLHLALHRGQIPVVVYKAGQVGEGDGETWERFPIPFDVDRRGLGGSQAGEVAYLRHYLRQLGRETFDKVDVNDLALEMARSSWRSMHTIIHGEEGCKKMVVALRNCPEAEKGLAQLCLDTVELREAGIKALQPALGGLRSLKTLRLNSCRLGEAGGAVLAEALPACRSLKELRLWNNELGEAAGAALAGALPACRMLRELNLRGNRLGETAGVALAGALPTCRALREIHLWSNRLGEDAGVALAGALPACRVLAVIGLSDNELGEATGVALAGALPRCRALREIRLSGNRLGEAGGVAIVGALPSCHDLEEIRLGDNGLSEATRQALREAALPALRLFV